MRARILIVDDEKNVRATVARALALEGHETVEVGDADAAMARLDGGGFDAAVFDLSMPGRGGLELLQEMQDRGDVTPVIILTAHATVDRAVESLKLGECRLILRNISLGEHDLVPAKELLHPGTKHSSRL